MGFKGRKGIIVVLNKKVKVKKNKGFFFYSILKYLTRISFVLQNKTDTHLWIETLSGPKSFGNV